MKRIVMLSAILIAGLPMIAEAKPKGNKGAKKENPNNYRPRNNGPTYGMGVGMSVPSNGLDTYIFRVRVNPSLTIEPMVNIGKTTAETTTTITTPEVDEDGAETGNTTSSDSKSTTNSSWVGGGLSVRYRIAKRGNTDLQVLGGAGYLKTDSDMTIQDVDGTETETSTSLSANVGVGMENFFAPKWSAGVDITTPIYNQVTSTSNPIDPVVDNIVSTTGTGNLFSPSFRLMLTHYF